MNHKRIVIDGTQECIGCHQWKPLDQFYKHKTSSTGRAYRCKDCHKTTLLGGLTPSQRAQAWAKTHPEAYAKMSKESRDRIITNPKRLEARRKSTNKWYSANRQTSIASHRKWLQNNPWAVIADNCRSLVRMTLIGFSNGGPKFKALCGCSGSFFRQHIQSQFLQGMNWTNFGRGGWTLGHIKSVATYKDSLLTLQGQQSCFHYSNLQPEWERSNRAQFTRDSLTPAQLLLESHPSP